MKAAICFRVTAPSGQNRGGAALHPVVIPAATKASMTWKNGWFVGTSLNVAVAGAGLTCKR